MALIDASVAVRWFVHGPGSEAASAWQTRDDLVAPDFLLIEVANALWRYLSSGHLEMDDALGIVDRLPAYFSRLEPSGPLLPYAVTMAKELGHPVYDCIYLTLALRTSLPLVTGDRKLARVAERLDLNVVLIG